MSCYIMPDIIENFLQEERKSSTYKYALIVSILDYIIEHPIEESSNNFHFIPVLYIAKRFLYYYYPILTARDGGVQQLASHSEHHTNIALSKSIKGMIAEHDPGLITIGVIDKPESIQLIQKLIDEDKPLPTAVFNVLREIRSQIIDQPLQYAKFADSFIIEDDTRSEKVEFIVPKSKLFGLLHKELPWSEPYEIHLSKGKEWLKKRDYESRGPFNYTQLADQENLFMVLGSTIYQQLLPLRFWIKTAVINHWISFSAENCFNYNQEQLSLLYYAFKYVDAPPERESLEVYRLYAKQAFPDLRCYICNKEIQKEFELDHLIPWSKYPINVFWNLYPICKTDNIKKSDKIVKISGIIKETIQNYLQQWVLYIKTLTETDIRQIIHGEMGQNIFSIDTTELVAQYMEELERILFTLV